MRGLIAEAPDSAENDVPMTVVVVVVAGAWKENGESYPDGDVGSSPPASPCPPPPVPSRRIGSGMGRVADPRPVLPDPSP